MTKEKLRVESETRGCFHGESAIIEVALDEDSSIVSISRTTGGGESVIAEKEVISQSNARHIIDRFLAILGTRQRLSGGRSTTVYACQVAWTLGSTRNEWNTFSSEPPVEVLDEALAGELDAQTKQKIKQYREGYFNIAHELHRTTMSIVEEYQTRERMS